MATSDILMGILLSEFTDAETLIEWAIENQLSEDPMVIDRLRGLETKDDRDIQK